MDVTYSVHEEFLGISTFNLFVVLNYCVLVDFPFPLYFFFSWLWLHLSRVVKAKTCRYRAALESISQDTNIMLLGRETHPQYMHVILMMQ